MSMNKIYLYLLTINDKLKNIYQMFLRGIYNTCSLLDI